MRHFGARLSPLPKVITLLTLTVFASIALVTLSRAPRHEGVLVLGVLAMMVLPGWLLSVRGYAVGQGQLIVKRPLWSTRIDLSGLSEASLMPELGKQFSISLFSTRGFFGMIGYAYKKGLGVYLMYATNLSKAVLLRFSSRKPVVVSPESPEDFLDAVLAEVKPERKTVVR